MIEVRLVNKSSYATANCAGEEARRPGLRHFDSYTGVSIFNTEAL